MEDKNYYDILGVSVKATAEEITAAKNTLAKRFHPDANLKDGIDTTQQMQEILEAYAILSDRVKRAEYDRKITGRRSVMQTYDLKKSAGEAEEQAGQEHPAGAPPAGFVIYWKSANDLYDIITESDLLFKEKQRSARLTQLSMEAIRHVLTLRSADIPERYWHPDIMNWLLFTWYKNRNITISYLLTLYDDYVKKSVSALDKLKLQKKAYSFQHSVKRLVKY